MNGSTWRLGLRIPGHQRWMRVRVDHCPQKGEVFKVKLDSVVTELELLEEPSVVIHTKFDVMTDNVKVIE